MLVNNPQLFVLNLDIFSPVQLYELHRFDIKFVEKLDLIQISTNDVTTIVFVRQDCKSGGGYITGLLLLPLLPPLHQRYSAFYRLKFSQDTSHDDPVIAIGEKNSS